MLNVAPVLPAATVTVAGTVAAAVLLLDSPTAAPPAGAALVRVMVPCDGLPPVTLAGLTVRAASVGDGVAAVIPSPVDRIVFPFCAESRTVVPATGNVVTVKVALVVPAGTVTLAGTLAAAGRLLDSATIVPPAGAALGTVTVPVAGFPPGTLVGLTVNADSVGAGGGVPSGFTVRSAASVTPPPVTEIVTTVVWDTDLGRIWMAPLVLPAGIVTLLERKGSTAVLLLVTCRD